MEMFKINGVDLTQYITVPSYVVNRQDVYKEWEDANGLKHRQIVRTRISGQFTMKFFNEEDYFRFLEILKDNKTAGGYTPVALYVNNINEVVYTSVFIQINPANTIPYFGTSKYEGFDVTIEER